MASYYLPSFFHSLLIPASHAWPIIQPTRITQFLSKLTSFHLLTMWFPPSLPSAPCSCKSRQSNLPWLSGLVPADGTSPPELPPPCRVVHVHTSYGGWVFKACFSFSAKSPFLHRMWSTQISTRWFINISKSRQCSLSSRFSFWSLYELTTHSLKPRQPMCEVSTRLNLTCHQVGQVYWFYHKANVLHLFMCAMRNQNVIQGGR